MAYNVINIVLNEYHLAFGKVIAARNNKRYGVWECVCLGLAEKVYGHYFAFNHLLQFIKLMISKHIASFPCQLALPVMPSVQTLHAE